MITIRPATEADIPLVFAWRNKPEVYQGFYSHKSSLNYFEHLNWWYSRPHSWHMFIIMLDEKPIGLINIGQCEHWSPELGWMIGETEYWSKGYCQEALKLVFEWLKERGYKHCHTTIKWDNEASGHLAWKLGFVLQGEAREGESWLTKNLTTNYLI